VADRVGRSQDGRTVDTEHLGDTTAPRIEVEQRSTTASPPSELNGKRGCTGRTARAEHSHDGIGSRSRCPDASRAAPYPAERLGGGPEARQRDRGRRGTAYTRDCETSAPQLQHDVPVEGQDARIQERNVSAADGCLRQGADSVGTLGEHDSAAADNRFACGGYPVGLVRDEEHRR
jgi:hypothetical protein